MHLTTAAKTVRIASLIVATTLFGTGASLASPITYDVNQIIGAGSVVGTIQTNGQLGVLSAMDISNWNLTLNGVGATFNITNADSVVLVSGNDLTATAADLSFNFSGNDSGYLLFQNGLFSGTHYYCDATSSATCYQGASVVPESITSPSAQNVAVAGSKVIATARIAIPEPGSILLLTAALAGLALLRQHRKTG